jgi:peptide/nickel transport system substrate-binding protein
MSALRWLIPFLIFSAATADAPRTLRFLMRADARTLDPLLVEDSSSETIRYLTSGVLVRLNRFTQQATPALATQWKVSEGGKRIEFVLRPGVRFSDGSAFVPADVVATVRRMMDPAVGSPLADEFGGAGKLVEAKVTGVDSVSIRFASPIANLPDLFDQVTIQSAKGVDRNKACLGPFVIADRKAGAFIRLRRNPNYWELDDQGNPLPRLDEIRIDIQTNPEAEALAFDRGEVDLIQNLDADLFERMARQGRRSNLHDAGPSLDTEQLWFNLVPTAPLPDYKKQWFASARFRRAFSAAIQRDDLCRLIYKSHAVPAVGPVAPSNKTFFNASLPGRSKSFEVAMKEIAADGFTRRGSDLFDRYGHLVELSIITNAGSKVHERMLVMIQQDVAKLGIRLNILTLDFPSLIERITRTFAYEAVLLSMTNVGIDPNEQMNVWLSSAPNHQWNPNQKSPATAWEREIDKYMTAQAAATDLTTRKKLFARVQEIAREQEPFIYLVHPNALCAISSRVRNAAPVLLRPQAYWNIERLAVDPGAGLLSDNHR